MPKNRTPTTETPRSATEGCRAAVEMSHADVPISATLEPMVRVLRRTESATQFQEPWRNCNSRPRIGCWFSIIGNWGVGIGDWRLETGELGLSLSTFPVFTFSFLTSSLETPYVFTILAYAPS